MPQNLSRRYFAFLVKHSLILHVLLFAITIFAGVLTAKLQLKTDFSQLLPEKLKSVQNIRVASQRVGGTGVLLIGIKSPDFKANKDFVEALAEKLRTLEGKQLRYFEYRFAETKKFLEKYSLHYLSNEQLGKLKTFVNDEIEKNKDQALGSFLGFDDEKPIEDSKESSKDWLNEIDPNFQKFLSYRDAYLSADDGKTLVMTLRPFNSSLGVGGSRELIRTIQDFVDEINPKGFHPEMHVGFGGNVQSTVDEFETVRKDIFDTALILVVLILIALYLFFWSVRLVSLLTLHIIAPVLWTFALTWWHIGYLNTQTAFLGSLVVGTGINYGVILLARYLERRKHGDDIFESLAHSIGATAISTLIASSTTAVAFVSLLTADNKGFSQFGFIGGVGVVLCWLAAYTFLPLWIYHVEKFFPRAIRKNPLSRIFHAKTIYFGEWLVKNHKGVLVVVAIFSIFCVLGFRKLFSDPLEYNFDNLRNKISKSSGVAAFEKDIRRVFATSNSPAVVMLDSAEEAKEICPTVRKIAADTPSDLNVIHTCMSLWDLVPKTQTPVGERTKLLGEVKTLLGHRLLKYSPQGDTFKAVHENLSLTPPQLKDVPSQLSQRFKEKDNRVGLIAFVYPINQKPINNGHNLLSFTSHLTDIKLPNSGRQVSATGEMFILGDLLQVVKTDGPRVGGLAFLGVILIAIFLCGGLKNGIFMAFCLLLSTWWMLGLQGWFGIKFNFFNFIALPLTFGIGIDYPINVFIRCKQENFKDYGRVLASSGTAVLLCALTTIISYATLLNATSQALASFAKLAIIGEITTLTTALLILPVILRAMGKFTSVEAGKG